jgi:hypothetical protein
MAANPPTPARRAATASLALATLLPAAGCGAPVTPGADAALESATPAADAATDAPSAPDGDAFVPAPHGAFPTVPDQGGRRMHNPQLVAVTFPGYDYTSQIEALNRYLFTSAWWAAVGSEYGLGPGTFVRQVELPTAAPGTITDGQIQALLAARIADGTLPGPPVGNGDYYYAVYFPRTTTVLGNGGATSCVDFTGYHSVASTGGRTVAYGVLPSCFPPGRATELEVIERASSHELIEAATDIVYRAPAFALTNPDDPFAATFGEVADLCFYEGIRVDGHFLTRSWSNAAAVAGHAPCVPAASAPYFNVAPASDGIQPVSAGGTSAITLTGWSEAPIADWVVAASVEAVDFAVTASLSATTINNGRAVTLTVRVPPAATPDGLSLVIVTSYPRGGDVSEGHSWPVVVRAQ